MVKLNWNEEITAINPFSVIQKNLKRVKSVLAQWCKNTFGNVSQQIATLEDLIKAMEIQLEITPMENNRMELNKAEANLKRYLDIKKEFWRQKRGLKWFKDGDRNIKFFLSYVKGKKRKLQVTEIKMRQGDVITSIQNIGDEVVEVFKEQFEEGGEQNEEDYLLDTIPKIILEEQNNMLDSSPSKDEVKQVVFDLNRESASGPDSFSGLFFKKC